MDAANALVWHARRPVPLDFGGPSGVAYRPLPDAEGSGIDWIEAAAARSPDATAVYDGETRLSYAALLDRVYGLAARIEAETPPGTVIASLVRSSAAAPVIILACVAAGRVLVPVDAGNPPERQRALFAESGAAALITPPDVDPADVAPAGARHIVVDVGVPTGAPRVARPLTPDRPMVVTFTSGSTGRPKGIAFSNAYAHLAVRQFVDAFHINADDVVIGISSLATGGARDTMVALSTGATIRILDFRRAGIVEALRVLGEEKVTVLSFVPSIMRTIMAIPGIGEALRHLRVLDLHGERVLASDIALFRSVLPPGCHISVTMGSSEAGTVFSWFVQDGRIEGAQAPVGYLVPGKRFALVGKDGRPAAPGEVGELVARGPMALGRWQGGRLVPGAFLPDPDDPAARIYPMGDLVRLRDDGLIEYAGRRDRNVKVRGLWADLAAVETALREVAGIGDAAVMLHGDGREAERIVAFVASDPGAAPPDAVALREEVAARTAPHMVPQQLHVLPAIPYLPNYKLDLVALGRIAEGDR